MSDDSHTLAHGRMLALLVHDLRNPTATLTANVEYLRETGDSAAASDDFREALEDVHLALGSLKSGLDRMAWIARWLTGDAAMAPADGDVGTAVRVLCPDAMVEPELAPARGGGGIAKVLQIFVENTRRHARGESPDISVFAEDDGVVVRIDDSGAAIAPELREGAFTVEGQSALKGRADGRYAQFAGLVAARAVMEGLGGRVQASSHADGGRIELWLPFA